MNSVRLKRILAGVIAFAVSISMVNVVPLAEDIDLYAAGDEAVTIYPTADIQFRSGNTTDFSTSKGFEVRHGNDAGDNYFLGGLKFDLSNVDTSNMKTATLELVTEIRDNNGDFSIKPFSDDWSEGSGNKYSDRLDIINEALNADAIVEFKAALGAAKIFEATGVADDKRKLSNWTSQIDVTQYVNEQILENDTTISMLITPQNLTNTRGAAFLSKDISKTSYNNDSRWDAILQAFSAEIDEDNLDLLKPRLVIEYYGEDELPHPTTVTVSGKAKINSFENGASYTYTAQVKDQGSNVMTDQTVTWSSQSDAQEGAVSINEITGVMTVPANAPVQTVTIKAACGDIESEEFIVTIICEDESHPSTIALSGGVRMRGNGNALYDLYPDIGEELGASPAHAAAILQFDLTNVIASQDYLSKITLNLENSRNKRPVGAWLYKAPSDDTRTDGKTWNNVDWASASNKDAVKNNISLVLGIDDYATNGKDGVAEGRNGFVSPIAAASCGADGKYALELSGDILKEAIEYAKSNNNMLELVLTSSTADATTENRVDVKLSETYLSIDYSTASSIEISGIQSIDMAAIDTTATFKYTAAVYDQNGEKMSLTPAWSYKTTAKTGKIKFNTDTGIMTVSASSEPQTVTITAECEGISESIEVFIDKLVATSIEIDGADTINNYIATQERQYTYKAIVKDQKGNAMDGQRVTWGFSTDVEENAVTFDNGVITVPVNVADQTITLTAKCGDIVGTKTIKVGKEILDLPESFAATHSMWLRGLGNTATGLVADNTADEIGMKAGAPGLLTFDLSKIIEDASEVITGLNLTVYKESSVSISLGLWEYADPEDDERTDNVTWIDTDLLKKDTDWASSTATKADLLNNYSLIFGIDDFSSKDATFALGRSAYIAPITTAAIDSDNKYTFSITGEALEKIIAHAKENDGIAALVVTSADIDARSSSIKLYMAGADEDKKPALTVSYDLPSTPRRVDIAGNDVLYINNQVSSYTSQYTATVYDQSGDKYESQDIEWSADLGETTGVDFNEETGTLTIRSTSGEGTVTITASSAYAVGTKTVTIKKIPETFKNGNFEAVDDSYLADGWTPNVPVYKLNFDETDFYYPWNAMNSNDGSTLYTREQGYEGKSETGDIRGTSGIDSVLKLEYSSSLSDEDAESLMNSAVQMLGINNSTNDGFLTVGYEIPYYYMMDYYLSNDSSAVLSGENLYVGLEFRNKADTGFLASVATGNQFMPFVRGQWRTFTGTFTSGTANQINGQTRVNIGIRGIKGTAYADYFRLVPKGIDTQNSYEGSNSMLVANTLTWTSDIFSVESGSYYTYYASIKPESNIVSGQVTYTFMDNNYVTKGEYVVNTESGEWSKADENGWLRTEGQIVIPAGATICQVTLSNPDGAGNVWFDNLVFTKTEEARATSVRITGGNSEVVIPDTGENSYQYTAVVYDQYNNVVSSDVAWTVSNEDGTAANGVNITSNGILKVISSADEGNVVINVSKDGITASKTVSIIKKGDIKEPESTGEYGFNGSFTENDGNIPYGWTNSGMNVVNYTFDSGIESWKSVNSSYNAPMDGELKWANDENYTAGKEQGALLIYNPSFNMPGAQIPTDASIQGGMPYNFEMRFKQKNITDDSTVRADLRYFNSSGGTIAENTNTMKYYPQEYQDQKDSDGWQLWQATDTVPSSALTVRLTLRFRGGLNNDDGYAYFDDVKISKITSLDKNTTYNGNPSLMLVGYNENVTITGKEYGERWLSDKLTNISQGNSYEYSAMLQTYAAESGAYLSFVFYDVYGNEISTIKSDKVMGTTNSWTELAGSVVAPSGAESVAVGYNIDGKGTAWISGISFNNMANTNVSGIKINGAASVKIPTSGSKTESYTVNCVNSSGNAVSAADTVITASDLPSGVTFQNGILTVSASATDGTVKLTASYNGYSTSKTVSISKTTSTNTGDGGGGGGGGTGGGNTVTNVLKPSNTAAPDNSPMGNVKYGADSVSSTQSSSNNSTSEIPTLLQAPDVNYFSGGGKNIIFEDIDGVPWAKDAIEALYRAGVVKGKGDMIFAPNDNVTRAEFVTMLIKAFKITSDNNTNNFSDVNEDDWYNESVNTAVGNGIISGISKDYFGASENITRQDIAVMGVRLWNSIGKEMTGRYRASFTDFEKVSDYAIDAVTAMAEAGIVSGMDTGEFAPLENATRAQAAVIIYRMAVKYDE